MQIIAGKILFPNNKITSNVEIDKIQNDGKVETKKKSDNYKNH